GCRVFPWKKQDAYARRERRKPVALGPLSNSLQIAGQAISGLGPAVVDPGRLAELQPQLRAAAEPAATDPALEQMLLGSLAALAGQGQATMALPAAPVPGDGGAV